MAFLAALAVFAAVLVLGLRPRPRQSKVVEAQARQWLPIPVEATPGPLAQLERLLERSGSRLGARRFLLLVVAGGVLLAAVIYRVIGNLPVGLVLGAAAVGFPWLKLRQLERQHRETLAVQFKEALTSVAYSLKAGASLQTALERALTDLKQIFPGGLKEPIVQEFDELVRQIRLGVPVETALTDWERRLGLEDVSDFVSATLAVKSRGGNLAEVMAMVSETISWKIVAQAQIRALTSEKRSEANMLIAAPSVVLVALSLLSPSYIAPLFNTTGGQVILLVGVLCNLAAFFAVRKALESPL